jgi:glutamate-1-semialdehyde aminotransferase
VVNQLNLDNSNRLYEEALKLIPGGILGIRRPYNFVEGEYPIFFETAKGGKVTDVDGNEYLDMLCAYGPIIIGHREEEIDNAVIDQIKNKGFCMSLTQQIQNRLAKKLKDFVEGKGGIPEKLYEDVYEFEYNNLDHISKLMQKYGNDVAAIIITPINHPGGHEVEMPEPGYLEGVRELADKYNARDT